MIDGIFEEYDIHLDKKLHEEFSCPEELYKLGINNYLLRFIGDYDSMLANYLSVNLDLLDNLNAFVSTILKLKPASVKGDFVKSIAISSTMGPGIKIQINSFDK